MTAGCLAKITSLKERSATTARRKTWVDDATLVLLWRHRGQHREIAPPDNDSRHIHSPDHTLRVKFRATSPPSDSCNVNRWDRHVYMVQLTRVGGASEVDPWIKRGA